MINYQQDHLRTSQLEKALHLRVLAGLGLDPVPDHVPTRQNFPIPTRTFRDLARPVSFWKYDIEHWTFPGTCHRL
jgi:hypothetical protein